MAKVCLGKINVIITAPTLSIIVRLAIVTRKHKILFFSNDNVSDNASYAEYLYRASSYIAILYSERLEESKLL